MKKKLEIEKVREIRNEDGNVTHQIIHVARTTNDLKPIRAILPKVLYGLRKLRYES